MWDGSRFLLKVCYRLFYAKIEGEQQCMEKQAHTAEEGKQKMDEFEKECQLIIFMPQQRRNTEIRWDQPMTCCAERRTAGRLSNPLPDRLKIWTTD